MAHSAVRVCAMLQAAQRFDFGRGILRRWSKHGRLCAQATCKRSLEQVALKIYHMENLCELNHYQVSALLGGLPHGAPVTHLPANL